MMGRLLLAVGVAIALCAVLAQAKINVHIVCHTHDDVGWLKTVDQYFMGANNSIQHAGVQYVLDTVTQSLSEDINRKFVYVEQAFFQRWWAQQNTNTQNQWKTFVTNGQVEFINGGWCMHDEAAAHYVAMIDQTTTGHRFLRDEFGVTPKIGWQIDPFGHSSTQASLLSAEVGFDALFFGRIDYQDHNERMKRSGMEFVWRASPAFGSDAQVFAGAFQDGNYGPPDDFCFDMFCGDLPIQDDTRIADYNVQDRVNLFVQRVMEYQQHSQGNDIMFTMGSDFQFENAHVWYKNLDKLIKYVNADGRVNAFYSTPSQYVKAKLASGISWELKTDDFFPYADNEHSYWTGYFTSRPALKRMIRYSSGYLNAVRQFEVFYKQPGTESWPLEEASGLTQHHDAVSGTAKQHVTYDYAQRLSNGLDKAETLVNNILAGGGAAVSQCRLLNVSLCVSTSSSTSARIKVQVYNPMARSRVEVVSVPVAGQGFAVFESDNKTPHAFQIVPKPLSADPSAAAWSLVFPVTVPGLGLVVYYVRPPTADDVVASDSHPTMQRVAPGDPAVIQNEFYSLTFDTGVLQSITNKQSRLTTRINQQFLWYKSSAERDSNPSGAYIFRPNVSTPFPVSTQQPTLMIVTGPVTQEIRQTVSPWLTQTVRLHAGQNYIETEFQVGPIPFEDGFGKEIIVRYASDIKSAQLFYTDSNGRELLQRKINYRPTWTLNVTEPVAGNYYPINSGAFIRDSTSQFTIVNDRAQGVASLADGQLEVMLHRRILADDWRGVGEPLNETEGISAYPDPKRRGLGLNIVGKHFLVFDTPATSAKQWRPLASRVFSPPILAFSASSAGDAAVKVHNSSHWSHLPSGDLPVNVDLMTLQVMTSQKGSTLIRLSHLYGIGEDDNLSRPVDVSLTALFAGRTVSNVVELSLSANQLRSAMAPIPTMRVRGEPLEAKPRPRTEAPPRIQGADIIVTISPAEIRTYSITLS